MPWVPDVAPAIKSWASFYSDHTMVSTTITYLHLAGLVVGGGAAVTTDRQILRAWHRGGDRRPATLVDVAAVHAFVVGGLALTVVTGALMTLSDLDTFKASPIFWCKMAGVALLLANGAALGWAERAAVRTRGARGWPVLGAVSTFSIALWLVTLFLGTYLKAAA